MKITQRKLKEWFPADRRFLHFCAKYYKMSFYNDDIVELASQFAIENVMNLYNRGEEFESEQHMTGIVMSCFRYGILKAYTESNRPKNTMDIKTESEITYGSGDDEWSVYMNSAVADTKEYDNIKELVKLRINDSLDDLQKECIKRYFFNEDSISAIARDIGHTHFTTNRIIKQALQKLKDEISENEQSPQEDQPRNSEPVIEELPRIHRDQPSIIVPEQDQSYTEAMSFLYS